MSARILVIRGGAIGDFILTLPAIRLLREHFPAARIEILGYPAIARLGLDPCHADAVHSIESAALARFFGRPETLDEGFSAFFAGFQQVISYLYDPDGLFEANLRRVGVKNLLVGPGKLDRTGHAAGQLARPLQQMALFLEDTCARFYPTGEDEAAAADFLRGFSPDFVAIHPGSGSPRKNWPVEWWGEVIRRLRAEGREVLLVGGEADEAAMDRLEEEWELPVARDLPLRMVGAILARATLFLGHDSGISHLAAATGTRCVLLFGPTDPLVWAPQNPGVTVLDSRGNLADIPVETVWENVRRKLG